MPSPVDRGMQFRDCRHCSCTNMLACLGMREFLLGQISLKMPEKAHSYILLQSRTEDSEVL